MSNTPDTPAEDTAVDWIARAFQLEVPVVGVLGQLAGWTIDTPDPVLPLALAKLGRSGPSWSALASKEGTPAEFYVWLGERFARRAPAAAMEQIADAPLSAVFTSSIDPGLANLLSTNGREADPILVGDPRPAIIRSRRRPPIYYLYGRAGAEIAEGRPPSNQAALAQRRMRHANAMLQNLCDAATPVGLIVIDGLDPRSDWLRTGDLLALLTGSAVGKVIWCGPKAELSDEDADIYASLIETGSLIRDERTFAHLLALARSTVSWPTTEHWDEPEVVTLSNNRQILTTPKLRLATQASATIIDDSWTGFLAPLSADLTSSYFHSFHAIPSSLRTLSDGIRREYSIIRDFEAELLSKVEKALARHHEQSGPLVLHGQSGVGKTIALMRLALRLREAQTAAVLFCTHRFPQPTDVSDFLALVDRVEGSTIVIVDANVGVHRYDELLRALRSRGHRVVVLGTSYRLETSQRVHSGRFVEAPALLSSSEEKHLVALTQKYAPEARARVVAHAKAEHALVRFYWDLPASRGRLSEGLGKEARAVSRELALRGTRSREVADLSDLGRALVAAGFDKPTSSALQADDVAGQLDGESAADRVIDFVMVVSRLYLAIPVSLVLRAATEGRVSQQGADLRLIQDLFEGFDLFRWRFGDEEGRDLLVSSRLQMEAAFICDRRLGGPTNEARRIIDLIRSSYRAGADDNDETRFLIDIVFALGPDGPLGDRYRDSYAEVARALTELRRRYGVLNARLMLQESTLRRAYVRLGLLNHDDKAVLLDEASGAVDDALQALEKTGRERLHASKRTRDNLWVERAATYGFLATDSAQRKAGAAEVWSSYLAARAAVRNATGRVDTYFPLDIGLWLPADILRETDNLSAPQRAEILADLLSTLDSVEPANLEGSQAERFQQQRLRLSEVLGDATLSAEAFSELEAMGSAAGYYIKARALMPERPETGEIADHTAVEKAVQASAYLAQNYSKIIADVRCLHLQLNAEWLKETGRWLLRGQRQPLPITNDALVRLRRILLDLTAASSEQIAPRFRYLEAVLNWLTNDEASSIASWRALARDTEYVESARVLNRHTIFDASGKPRSFTGVVDRNVSEGRWSLFVRELNRHVDLVERDFGEAQVAIGRTIRDVGISFNYIGPLAYSLSRRPR